MGFQGSRLVFRGSRLVFHVFLWFQVWLLWFQVDFYRHLWFQVGLIPSWALEPRSETLRTPQKAPACSESWTHDPARPCGLVMIMRMISSPRQRQSTASVSAAGLLGLQETWSKRSEAERSPLLFLISCVRSSSMQNDQINLRKPDRARRSGWRWEHQSWREQSVEQAGVELRRWGRRSTVRSSSWRSTWLENTMRSELQIKISNCFIRDISYQAQKKLKANLNTI